MKIYRQGDILLKACERKDWVKEKEDGVILCSSVTGHSHKITNGKLLESNDRLAVVSDGTTKIVHEEHGEILLPKGYYDVVRQRELGGFVYD